MTPAVTKHSSEEVAQIGQEIYERVVKPRLTPEDDGKHAVIDIETQEYEIDINEWDAIKRLSDRHRGAQFWLVRIGGDYQMSYRLRFGTILHEPQ